MGHVLLTGFFNRMCRLVRSMAACWLLVGLTIAGATLGATLATADTVNLQSGDFAHALAPDIRFLEDAEKALSIDQVLKLDPERDFNPVETKLVDFGFNRSRYWLRAPIRNATNEKATWKLAVEFPYIEHLEVYLVHSGNGVQPIVEKLLGYGEVNVFSDRGLNYRYFAPTITLDANAKAEIVLAYSSKQATQLPIFIESPGHFLNRIRGEDLVNWSILILLLGMTLVSTVYLVALGFSTAVYYGTYVLFSALYLFHTDGYAFQYLWPDQPVWNSVAVAPIGLTLVASGSLFARSFVNAPEHFPRLNRLLLGSVCIVCLLMLVSPWFIQKDFYKTGSLLFVIVCGVFYFAAGVLAVRRGQAGAWFFVAASAAIISSILFGIYGYLNPGNFNQDIAGTYGRYALFFEGIAFSLAIFLHIQAMRGEHEGTLQREIEVTREKLAISEELHLAQRNHEHAVAVAESRREQLATTAHDIKQPLTSLRMALMRMDTSDDRTADQILGSFDYLDQLVRTNLEQTDPQALVGEHADSGQEGVPDTVTPIDPYDAVANNEEQFPVMIVLSNVLAMFRDEARDKGLALKLVPSSASVKTQPIALMRIVSNLVSNSIKYTHEGRVVVGCRQEDETLRIEIHDSGPGIPDDDIERLLQPYERGETPGGTGLGLAVVSELAQQHGMTFDISSIPGRGTVSKLTVPLH